MTLQSLPTCEGFTLIELAVVIAIVAILATVAIPRFVDTAINTELSILRGMRSMLTSAAASYTAKQGATPVTFDQFVVNTQTIAPGSTAQLSTFGMDKKDSPGPADACPNPGGITMVCTLTRWRATYTYSPENAIISASIDPINTNPDPAVQM